MKFAGLFSRGYKSVARSVRSNLRPILIITATLVGLIAVIVISYIRHRLGYDWHEGTGFEGRTLWDWLELLIVPVVLGFGALFFSQAARDREQKSAEDQQREEALQNYLDKMAELLLKEKLLEKRDNPDDPVVDVAQVRTVTTLRILDRHRKNVLFQFLRDANLADFLLVKSSLVGADLSKIRMYDINLTRADLVQANLNRANLTRAAVAWADLTRADLTQANLAGADLGGASLGEACLFHADLTRAFLFHADLTRAALNWANLSGADLTEADLTEADLTEADLTEAEVTGANLTRADLTSAIVAEEWLSLVSSLKGATMPDGTVHE